MCLFIANYLHICICRLSSFASCHLTRAQARNPLGQHDCSFYQRKNCLRSLPAANKESWVIRLHCKCSVLLGFIHLPAAPLTKWWFWMHQALLPWNQATCIYRNSAMYINTYVHRWSNAPGLLPALFLILISLLFPRHYQLRNYIWIVAVSISPSIVRPPIVLALIGAPAMECNCLSELRTPPLLVYVTRSLRFLVVLNYSG